PASLPTWAPMKPIPRQWNSAQKHIVLSDKVFFMNSCFDIKIPALLFIVLTHLSGCSSEQGDIPQPMGQFPSPMADNIRVHERVEPKQVGGLSISLKMSPS
nr:hypothetical protein [Chlamydiota bacterium]